MPLRFGRSKGLKLGRSRGYISKVTIKPLQRTENVTIIIPNLSFVTGISVLFLSVFPVGDVLIIRNIFSEEILHVT